MPDTLEGCQFEYDADVLLHEEILSSGGSNIP